MHVYSSFVHKVSSHGCTNAEMHGKHEKTVADGSRLIRFLCLPVFFGNGDALLRPVLPSDVHRERHSQSGQEEE